MKHELLSVPEDCFRSVPVIVRIATAYRMAYMTRGGDGGQISKLQTQTSQNVQFSMERQQKAIYLRIQP
jgi:hypothetical protein